MNVNLTQTLIDKLASAPESGMGYQIVDVILRDGRTIPSVLVFNCEQAVLPDDVGRVRSRDIIDVRVH